MEINIMESNKQTTQFDKQAKLSIYQEWMKVDRDLLYQCQDLFYQCLNKNINPQMFNEIQTVKFTQLKFLSINASQITNIEILTLINFKSLMRISAHDNWISRISCFNKLMIPNLQQFYFHRNPIAEINSLERMKMNENRKNIIEVQLSRQQTPIGQDLSLFCKIKIRSMKIYIDSQKRIKQGKITKMLQPISFKQYQQQFHFYGE